MKVENKIDNYLKALTFLFALCFWSPYASGQKATGNIYELQEGAKTKVNWDFDTIQSNSRKTFLTIKGEGVINKMWWTTFPSTEEEDNILAHNVVLNIYWDDNESPAVSAPLADFFCQPLKLQAINNHFFNSSNHQLVFNSSIPMPFRTGAKIELVNYSDKKVVFFYGVDLELKKLKENALYLHSYWQRFDNWSPDEGFSILPEINGNGRYLGTHLALYNQKTPYDWHWYERTVTVNENSQNGQGNRALFVFSLDDFIGSGWWDREREHNQYSYEYAGRPLVEVDNQNNLSLVMYRYHVKDPIWFQKNISFHVGNNWNLKDKEIARGDWYTTAFFYLDKPTNNLPKIQNITNRFGTN